MKAKKGAIRIPERWQEAVDAFVAVETLYQAHIKGNPQAERVLTDVGKAIKARLAAIRYHQTTGPLSTARAVHQTVTLRPDTPTPAQLQAWFDLPGEPRQAEGL
jgi:hypothetical protein